MDFYNNMGMNHLSNINNNLLFNNINEDIELVLQEHYEGVWYQKLRWESALRGPGHNKLRTYKKFKQSFETEMYTRYLFSERLRANLAKFRCGTAPLNIETVRYTGTPEDERLCTLCDLNHEEHSLIGCPLCNTPMLEMNSLKLL